MGLRHPFAYAAAIIGLGMIATQTAFAATVVMGRGLAQSCYRTAEFNGDPRTGIADCSGALAQQALTPRDRTATYVNRGILRTRNDDVTGALSDYNAGVAIWPDLAEAYVDRGAAYIALKRYREALRDIDRGLALGAKMPHLAYYDPPSPMKRSARYGPPMRTTRRSSNWRPISTWRSRSFAASKWFAAPSQKAREPARDGSLFRRMPSRPFATD